MTTARRTPPKVARPTPAPLVDSPVVADLERRLRQADDPRAVLEAFWAGPAARTPVVEPVAGTDEVIVTFLWRDGTAGDVLLFVNRLTDERRLDDSLMRRLHGTDVWHLAYRMRSDWRASYSLVVSPVGQRQPWRDDTDQASVRQALDHGSRDPGNPEMIRNVRGVAQSVVVLPGAPPQPWLDARAGVPGGALSRAEGPDGRAVWLYRTADAGDTNQLPLLLAFDGEIWTSSQDLATTLDNLRADRRIPPMCAVFVGAGNRATRWSHLGAGSGVEDWVADRLLPWVRQRLPVTDDPSRVVAAGQSLGALAALACAVQRPDSVGCVVSQSASLWQTELFAALADRPWVRARVYLEVGRQEWVLLEPNRDFARRLTAAGAHMRMVEFNGGHDYACWRGGIADGVGWIAEGWPDPR